MEACWLYNDCNHKDCDKQICVRKYKMDSLCDEALLSIQQRQHVALKIDSDGTDFNEFKRLANIETHIEEFIAEKQNLFLHSSTCGNGKSSWAVRMLMAHLDNIWAISELSCKGLFISVPMFLLASKERISAPSEYYDKIKSRYLSADIVIWDDIASKTGSEYEISQLQSMIDARINLGKTNIFTSNLNAQQLAEALGERIASRICNLSVDIELHGSDKRGLKQEVSKKW